MPSALSIVPRPHPGPWCPNCGHEYRSREGVPEQISAGNVVFIDGEHRPICGYCGARERVVFKKPFKEISHSALELYDTCPTRFWFQRVAKIEVIEAPNPYAEAGKIGHSLTEDWYRFGKLPPINDLGDPKKRTIPDKMAISVYGGIPHMPPRNLPGLDVETEFHFFFEGVHFSGFKDLTVPLALSPGAQNFDPASPSYEYPAFRRMPHTTLVQDNKFVGTDMRFVPSSWELDQLIYFDVDQVSGVGTQKIWSQPTIYDWDDVRRGAQVVHNNWVYMPRGERGAQVVRGTVKAELVYERMRPLAARGREMLQMLEEKPKDPRHLPVNPAACDKYRSLCPYISLCHCTDEMRALRLLSGLATAKIAPLSPQPTGEKTVMTQPALPNLDTAFAAIGLVPPGAPATVFAPPPAPVAPPAAPVDTGWHQVEFRGLVHTIVSAQCQGAVNSGARYIGPAAGPAEPFSPQAPAPVAAPAPAPAFAPPPSLPAPVYALAPAPPAAPQAPPAVAGTRPPGTRGRKPKNLAAAPVAPGGVDLQALAAAIVDELIDRLSPAE